MDRDASIQWYRFVLSSQEHKRYPYLLSELIIDRPNQVWCADITYIRMLYRFIYLVAVMDRFSRYILVWETSTTLETAFCVQALEKALRTSEPEIFNTNQGVQFTSVEFVEHLQTAGIRISMDGRGRVYDNIFVERLWRTVKYEEVYLHDYSMVSEARNGLARYFLFHNGERLHTTLGNRTPYEVYFKQPIALNPGQASQTMHQIQPTFLS